MDLPLEKVSTQKLRIKADLFLFLASLVWGSAFAAQRVAALQLNAFAFNGLRFLLGALILLPLAKGSWRQLDRQSVLGAGLAGLILFAGAAFQQVGMQFTTAGNAGFITGLYVVFIPLFLALGWRQRPGRSVWLASILAALGLFLLSTGGKLSLTWGDSLELAGAVLWAFHVILIGHLARRMQILPLSIGQSLVCAVLNLLVAGLSEGSQAWRGLDLAWWAVIYTGIFSIGLGYTLQAAGQRVAPAADAAILLSAESVFAAFFGWLLLGEMLGPLQLLGCGLILAGMILAQARAFVRDRQQVQLGG
jgi:drug/metabolite transporter (DMT)-like permease